MNRSCSTRPTSACCARRCGSRKGCGRSASRCSSLLIALLLIESLLLVIAGRGREAEALVHMRTYQEEVAEALEATGVADGKDGKP